MIFEDDHQYMMKLNEALKEYSKVLPPEIKQGILSAFFLDYKNGLHLFHLQQTVFKKGTVTENDRITTKGE